MLYRAVLASSLAPLFVVDSHGKILVTSESVQGAFGWSPEELKGQNIKILIPDPHHSHHDEYLERYRRTGETFLVGQPREFEAQRRDGTTFPCNVAVSLVDFPEEPEAVFSGIIRDISDRKQAEQERRDFEVQIQHAQKLESLGVLAGGIAHDFNNLLTSMLGNASLALEEMAITSPARDSVERIVTAAKRAADLTRQMLAYSGKGKFIIERIDVSQLVEEICHLLEVTISKNVVVKFNLDSNLPPIEADVSQIRQVIMNLITNASDAIEDKSGVITVTTGAMEADRAYLTDTFLDEDLPEGIYTYLEVSDTGCGMNAETKERLFDPFFTTKATGRGLGLAAVLGIVRGHRGAIKCYSELGRGTTIKMLLPAVNSQADPVQPNVGRSEEWSGSGTVLVVDDEETVRAVARRMLEMTGFNVLTACDGAEGVEVFRDHADEIDVVLLDMTMPRLSGSEAFREMRRIRSDVRVILSSGYNEQESINRFAGKGLAGFLQKPYQRSDLVDRLRHALERS